MKTAFYFITAILIASGAQAYDPVSASGYRANMQGSQKYFKEDKTAARYQQELVRKDTSRQMQSQFTRPAVKEQRRIEGAFTKQLRPQQAKPARKPQ